MVPDQESIKEIQSNQVSVVSNGNEMQSTSLHFSFCQWARLPHYLNVLDWNV